MVPFAQIISAKSNVLNECIKSCTCFDVFTFFDGTFFDPRTVREYVWLNDRKGPDIPVMKCVANAVIPLQCCDWCGFLFIESKFCKRDFSNEKSRIQNVFGSVIFKYWPFQQNDNIYVTHPNHSARQQLIAPFSIGDAGPDISG